MGSLRLSERRSIRVERKITRRRIRSKKSHKKRKQPFGDAISPADTALHKRIKEKSEENVVVYLQGRTVKLTSRNPRSIKEAFASAYGTPLKYEVRGQSLKISCVNTEQKAAMLKCTDIRDTAVEASILDQKIDATNLPKNLF